MPLYANVCILFRISFTRLHAPRRHTNAFIFPYALCNYRNYFVLQAFNVSLDAIAKNNEVHLIDPILFIAVYFTDNIDISPFAIVNKCNKDT